MLARAAMIRESPKGKLSKRTQQPTSFEGYFSSEQEFDQAPASRNYHYRFADMATGAPGDNEGSPKSASLLRWSIQTKLKVGTTDDPLEREADNVAEHVMRMPSDAGAEGIHRTGGFETGIRVSGEEAPPAVHEALRSPGEPLGNAERAFFEPRFGHDFSQVRVHSDPMAQRSADNLAARTYTVGPHIVLGSATPATPTGQSRLIAHELAHVVQQTGRHCVVPGAGFGLLQRDDKKATPDPIKAAKDKLIARYKLRGIAEKGTAAWTGWELRAVESAISKMSKDEQALLEGVTLMRTDEPLTVKNKGKDVKVVAMTIGTTILFSKGSLAGKTTALHELGHEIQYKTVAATESRAHHSQTHLRLQLATDHYNRAVQRTPRTGSDAVVTLINSVNAAGMAANNLLTSGPENREEKEALHGAAQSQADMDRMPLDKSAGSAEVKAALELYDREREYASAIEAWLDEKEKVVGSRRDLKEFVDIVKKNHLNRKSFAPFTSYVASFWPDKPEEFFAESYATYRSNPSYLQSEARPLFNWFEKKGHLLPPEPPKQVPEALKPGGHVLPKAPLEKEAPVIGEIANEAEETFLPALKAGLEILRGGEEKPSK